ncbi:MAG: hypothetical protein ACJKSS_01910 [Patescibacteria group bacterium UBA2103]
MKKINRNAFNEKLIHRYLFERYYFGTKKVRDGLLPEKFHGKKINLIAPEETHKESGYRADLTIYFKDYDRGIPVEVKWSAKDLTKNNQLSYLQENEGFLVSFGEKENDGLVPHVTINEDDFTSWMQENVSKLARESLIYQAKSKDLSSSSQYWIVFLRGTSHKNFERMLTASPNSPFWAYTQNEKALRNILDIQQGDYCLFILGYAKEGMGVSANPKLPLDVSAWYLTKIKEPYYMILEGEKGTFFEDGNIPINKRRWPHFVDFEIVESFNPSKRFFAGKRDEYAQALADSVNYGSGAPAPLLRRQWDSLTDRLRKIKSEME